jgi:hypothetical protein
MKNPVSSITFTAILFAAASGLLAGCHQQPAQPSPEPPKGIVFQLPTAKPMRPQGLAAIKAVKGASSPFAKSDVVNYFTTHSPSRFFGKPGQVHVVSLEFLTSKQVSDRLHGESTGLPDGDPVGFATLSGTFGVSGPPPAKHMIYSSAYAAFDGSTGNLLMAGTLGKGTVASASAK